MLSRGRRPAWSARRHWRGSGYREHPHHRHGRHLDRRLPGAGRPAVARLGKRDRRPADPHAGARHRLGRRRRRLDRLGRRGRHAAVGPQSAGADPGPGLLRQGRHRADRHRRDLVLGRLPAALLGGEIKLDAAARRGHASRWASASASSPEEVAAGALEIAAANQVFGIRQVTTSRGRDPGELRPGRLRRRGRAVRHRGRRLPRHHDDHLAARSRQPLRLRPARLRCQPRLYPHHGPPAVRPTRTRSSPAWSELARRRRRHRGRGNFQRTKSRSRVADVRYFGEGHEVQVDIPRSSRAAPCWITCDRVPQRCMTAPSASIIGASRMSNWSISASRQSAASTGRRSSLTESARSLAATSAPQSLLAPDRLDRVPALPPLGARLRQSIAGPAIIEEYGSTRLVPPPGRCTPTATAISSSTIIRKKGGSRLFEQITLNRKYKARYSIFHKRSRSEHDPIKKEAKYIVKIMFKTKSKSQSAHPI